MHCLKLRYLLRTFFIIFFQVALVLFGSTTAAAQPLQIPSSAVAIPTITYTNGQQQLQAPDWAEISLSSLPPIEEPGWIQIPQKLAAQIGYDPSRIWQAGASVADVVMLGDVEEALEVGSFSMHAIANITNLDLKNIALSSLELAGRQTINDLVKAIPGLSELNVSQVEPIAEFLTKIGFGDAWNEKIFTIAQSKIISEIPLGEYLDLNKYGLDSIPGLLKSPLSNFRAWQQSAISQVPGLSLVPFSQFPLPLLNGGIKVATLDISWGPAEHGDPEVPPSQFISGAVNQKDQTVPVVCTAGKPCPYIELTGLPQYQGKRWAVGGSKGQWVKEGFGPLERLNNGWGASGVMVFGPQFGKVAVCSTSESTGEAKFCLFLRVCAKIQIPFVGEIKTCSPHFIGPIPLPFLTTREKGFVIVASTAKPKIDIPSKYQDQIDSFRQQYEPQDTPNSNIGGSNTLCGQGPGGVDFKALADATSSIEGNYNSIGQWGCDGAGNCGRGLGRYQLMTYRSDVRQAIQSQPGGREFYARLASGYSPTTGELNQYFSPSAQDSLFVRAQTENINYLMKRGASGDGLIACLGQMWYSGRCNNSNGRDYTGGPTIQQYGQTLVANYRKVLASASGKTCALASAGANGSKATGQLIDPASTGAPVTSDFGARNKPCAGCSSFHKGLDIGVPNGSAVKAADAGTVVYAGSATGYGKVLIIDHGNGLQTRYAHLEGFTVPAGTKVSQGQLVAKSDSTGVGTGAHLHFEVRENASPNKSPFDPSITAVDPRKYVKFK